MENEEPLSRRLPPVAPHDSCVVCFKGDTTTALALRGEAEWIIVALSKLGIPEEQAMAMVGLAITGNPHEVRNGEWQFGYRVCSDCARRAGFSAVGPADAVPVYAQPRD